MDRVVDRLLAQLPGLQGAGDPPPVATRQQPGPIRFVSSARQHPLPTPAGLWGRLALGLALGGMITAWPYFRECGFPLIGYMAAVVSVALAGGWVAVIAWKLRNEVAHILALLLVLWGLTLMAEVLLPRSGYAAIPAYWQCGDPGSEPSWMRWFGPA
jgi:hypothetical protein